MRQQNPWRLIALASALLVAVIWAIGAGYHVSEAWPARNALARVDLAREEIACGNRSASAANQQRCRDLAEIVSRAELAEGYFFDGLVVLAPTLLLFGVVAWRIRGRPERHAPHRAHPRLDNPHNPSAA